MGKVQATMSTEIALDTLQAANSIKRLTQLVNSSTNAWKAQESQMRIAGDYLGAVQAKYDGLSNTIQVQQQKIERLKQEQSQLKGSTAETAEQYLKYQQQIDQATTKLASLEAQQSKAKQSMDYYKSGLAELQKEYKAQNEASETYVKRLKAEGKEDEARQEQLKQYKGSIANLTKQYETQKEMLERIATQAGKTSDEYRKQKQRLDETATSLAHTRNAANKLNDEIEQSQRANSFVGRLKESFNHLGNAVAETETKTSRLKGIFSATFAANVIGDGFQAVLGNIKGKFDELISSSGEYVKYQQTMNATWLTLTGNAEDGKKMVDMTNQMAQAAANSTEMVDGMNQKFYAVTHNIDLTKKQTEAVLTLQDAFGQTDAAVENFSVQWAQMVANGKVSGEDMLSIVNTFPEMKQAIKDVAAEQLNISNMTTEQFAKLQSEGKITSDMAIEALFRTKDKYKDASKNFAETIGGMERTLESRMPAIIAAFRDPIDKMKNPFLGKVSEWVADKSTEDKFKTLGEHSAKGLETISNAFAKVFNLGNGTDKLNSFMDKMIEWVDKMSDKIAKNAPKIASFFTELKKGLGYVIEIGKAFGEGVWEATKGIVEGIAGAFKTLTGNSKNSKEPIKGVSGALGEIAKHKEVIKTVGKLFVAYFAASKVASGVNAVAKGITTLSPAFGALKTATAFLMANPFALAIAGIAALVAGFVMLYKHNKKFRDFCNGIAKSIEDGIGGAIKWLKNTFSSMSKGWNNFKKSISKGTDNVVKSIKNGAKKVGVFFVNVGKTIKNVITTIGKILIFANPVVLGFALMYKESAKFRKFVKGIVGFVGDLKDGISKKTSEIKKDWDNHWDKTEEKASKTWDGIKSGTQKSISNLADNVKDTHDKIHERWSKTWNKSKDFLSNKWDEINKDAEKKFGGNVKSLVFDHLVEIGNKFKDTWDGIRNGFSDMWNGLKNLARDGINAVIGIPNKGIDGINGLIHDFGGPKNAIGKIPEVPKFANGTGFFSGYRNPITKTTLAMLNDGNDSPETGNQEAVLMPNGDIHPVPGRNTYAVLPAGAEVLNASEWAMLSGAKPFAKGTGFWSKIWDTATNVAGSVWDGLKDGVDKFTKMLSFIADTVSHPAEALAKKFNPNSDKLDGVFKHLGNALYKKPVENAKGWWKELWSMANEKASPEVQAGAIGDDYQFKNRGADSGADPWGYFFKECVSFVASRLSNQGVNASLFSHLGNGNQWLNARVPHSSTPRPGMVAVYAKNGQNHVSTVSGVSGNSFSGEEYNYAGSHAYHAFAGRPISQADTFLDFGVHVADKAKEENSPLRKLIKSQVGGMFDWIAKMLAPLNMTSSLDNPQGGSVERWRSYVEKALKANGIEPTAFRVSKILATIKRESNGDPNAQNNWDSNALAGHPSIGLMQTIGPTFEAYKQAGHNNIRNGYDNLLAAINYIKHRYGTSDAAFNRVAAYGYANGGLVSKNGVYELAEGDMPEYVIPTDIAKRGRAWQLLSEAVARFAGDTPQRDHDTNSDRDRERVSLLEKKLDTMIDLLGQLVVDQNKQSTNVNVVLDKNDLYKKQASDVNLRNYQSLA